MATIEDVMKLLKMQSEVAKPDKRERNIEKKKRERRKKQGKD